MGIRDQCIRNLIMINFVKYNLPLLFDDVDKIFKEFEDHYMPAVCYGLRSWRIDKTID